MTGPRVRSRASVVSLAVLQLAAAPLLGGCGGRDQRTTGPEPSVQVPRLVPVDAETSITALGFDAAHGALALTETGVHAVRPDGRLGDVTVQVGGAEPLALSPDGTQLLFHGYGGATGEYVELLPARAGARRRWRAPIPASPSGFPAAYWSADGQRLLVETKAGSPLLDARTGRRLGGLGGQQTALGLQPLAPDGARAVVATRRRLQTQALAAGRSTRTLLGEGAAAASWSPDGRVVAAVRDGLVVIDVATRRRRTIAVPVAPTAIAWAPDSRRLAVLGRRGGADGESDAIAIVDTRTGATRLAARIPGGASEFAPLAWSARGNQLAYQRSDGSPASAP